MHRYRCYDEEDPKGIYVYVAIDGDVNASDTEVYHEVGADITLTEEIIDISSAAGGESNVQIGWRYYAKYDYWWIIDEVFVELPAGVIYSWQYINSTHPWFSSHSGDYAFWCGSKATGYFMASTDCSLTSIPIDLTTAKDAKLTFWAKWNINLTPAWPPDVIQILISEDVGVTWHKINLAIGRAGITGEAATDYWENSENLLIFADLSGWAGSAIIIKFRMIVNNDDYLAENTSVGFGGIYIDDIAIFGNSSTRSAKARTLAEKSSDLNNKPIRMQSKDMHCLTPVTDFNLKAQLNNLAIEAYCEIPVVLDKSRKKECILGLSVFSEVEKYFIPDNRFYFINAKEY